MEARNPILSNRSRVCSDEPTARKPSAARSASRPLIIIRRACRCGPTKHGADRPPTGARPTLPPSSVSSLPRGAVRPDEAAAVARQHNQPYPPANRSAAVFAAKLRIIIAARSNAARRCRSCSSTSHPNDALQHHESNLAESPTSRPFLAIWGFKQILTPQ